MVQARTPRLIGAVSVVLAVVVSTLAATVLWSAASVRATRTDIEQTTDVVLAYHQLQAAVADEAYAEAGYRRAPTPAARARIDEAAQRVVAAADAVRAVGDSRDGSTVTYLQVVNDRYVAEVRRTLDQDQARGTDDRVAGPALEAMRALVAGAVDAHLDERSAALAREGELLALLGWLLPAVLVLGAAALAVGWAMLTRSHRRLDALARDSERRACQDPLTGLANRSAFADALASALAADEVDCAVLMVDLDHFKAVNDVHGHAAGDEVLQGVARALLSVTREGDVVARLGGDEFAVVLRPGAGAARVAAKVVAAVAAVPRPDGSPTSTSVGIAVAPGDGTAPAGLLAAADAALYRAKQDGRGRAASTAPA